MRMRMRRMEMKKIMSWGVDDLEGKIYRSGKPQGKNT